MKFAVAAGLLLAAMGAKESFAQTMVAVDINKAVLAVQWAPDATSGTPDKFVVKCGNQSGVYTKASDIQFPGTTIPAKDAIVGLGPQFCVASAVNTFGESANSPELAFLAGAAPSGKAGLGLQAQ